MPEYAKLDLLYQTINDPTKNQRATRLIHDSIPENTVVFEIDSSYRMANFSIYFQLLRKDDELVLEQIKAYNSRQNEYNFSLKTRDLIATDNLALTPTTNSSLKLKKITSNDPHGAALHFSTRGSLGGIFVRTGLRMPEKPSLGIILLIVSLGLLIAYRIFPIISKLEWKGVSTGAFLLAIAILIIPSGEKACNLLIALAAVAGIVNCIRDGKVIHRIRENQKILVLVLIITLIYLVALSLARRDPGSVELLKIKLGLPMILLTVALNVNNKQELHIQLVAMFTGVIISVFTHLGWAFMFVEAIDMKSKLLSLPRFYMESSVFSRVHHSYLSTFYLISMITINYLKDRFSLRITDLLLFNLLIFMGLLFAFSRAAILSLTIILIYYLLSKILRLWKIEFGATARVLGPLVLGASLLLFVFSDFNNLYTSIQIKGLETRMDIWEVASGLVKQKPFVGWGPGAYQDALNLGNQSSSFNMNTWNVLNTHNQFLETSGMFGLLSALALVSFLFFPAGFAKQVPDYADLILTVAMVFIPVFLFESFLNRNLGILIFGLSYGLLIKITVKSVPYRILQTHLGGISIFKRKKKGIPNNLK